jgi:hypothetical protein
MPSRNAAETELGQYLSDLLRGPVAKDYLKAVREMSAEMEGGKINPLIPPASLVRLMPPEPAPAGNPVLDVKLEGSKVVLRATLNGKSVRRALKVIAEHGADNVNALLQGTLKPPTSPGGPLIVDAAGLTAMPRTSKTG